MSGTKRSLVEEEVSLLKEIAVFHGVKEPDPPRMLLYYSNPYKKTYVPGNPSLKSLPIKSDKKPSYKKTECPQCLRAVSIRAGRVGTHRPPGGLTRCPGSSIDLGATSSCRCTICDRMVLTNSANKIIEIHKKSNGRTCSGYGQPCVCIDEEE